MCELYCGVGEMLVFVCKVETESGIIEKGDKYLAAEMIGFGWNLERVTGNGPPTVRILNSQMGRYLKRCTD